ncbi:hypothetical protein RDI58_006455 [Solanum bulbocastanum]|uniref:Uncharacterized protein n=1 Tax=Solanum bulbocastanum TaxID=147425 RepID=A0AAN8UAX7_SOLBU
MLMLCLFFHVLATHHLISEKEASDTSFGRLPITLFARISFWFVVVASVITSFFPLCWILAAFISLVTHLLFLKVSEYERPFSVSLCIILTALCALTFMNLVILVAISSQPEFKDHSGIKMTALLLPCNLRMLT